MNEIDVAIIKFLLCTDCAIGILILILISLKPSHILGTENKGGYQPKPGNNDALPLGTRPGRGNSPNIGSGVPKK